MRKRIIASASSVTWRGHPGEAPGRGVLSSRLPEREASILVRWKLYLWVRAEVSDCQPHWPQQCKKSSRRAVPKSYLHTPSAYISGSYVPGPAPPTQDANAAEMQPLPSLGWCETAEHLGENIPQLSR